MTKIINRFLVMEVLAISFVFLGIFYSFLALNFLSLLLVFIYFVCAWNKCQTVNGAQMYSDRIYFLGYLCTIIGFMSIAVKIAMEPALLEAPGNILLSGGVSLFSTILGLILMNRFKEKAEELLEKEEKNETAPADPVDRMMDFFDKFEKRLEKSELARVQTMMKMFNASEFAQNLNKIAVDLSDGSNKLNELRNVSETSTSLIEALTTNLSVLQKQLRLFSTSYEKHSHSLEAFGDKVTELSKLDMAIAALTTSLGGNEGLNNAVLRSTSNILTFSQNVSGLKDLGKINEQIGSLSNVLSLWLTTVDQNKERLIAFSEHVEKIKSFGTELGTATGSLSKFKECLGNGHEFTREFITSVEELKTVLEDYVNIFKQKRP